MLQDKNKDHDEEDFANESESVEQPTEESSEGESAEDTTQELLASDIENMQAELLQLRTNLEEAHDRYLRTYADFDNFRKRQREEVARRENQARADIIEKILPVITNFQRAMQAAEAQHSYESLLEGVSLTFRQMTDMLEKEGVKPIDAIGEQFNPEMHEAVASVPTDDYPDHSIIDEIEKGYTIKDRVICPAKVIVAVTKAE